MSSQASAAAASGNCGPGVRAGRADTDKVLRPLAVLAASPQVEGVIVAPGASLDVGEPLWPERYPLTPARRKYLETYNTRVVSSPVPSIALELVTHDLFSSKK